MNHKNSVKTKIIVRVIIGVLINYGWFILFERPSFDIGSAVTVGMCSYVLYDELSNNQ